MRQGYGRSDPGIGNFQRYHGQAPTCCSTGAGVAANPRCRGPRVPTRPTISCKNRAMDASSHAPRVRVADLSGSDEAAVSALVEAYLLQTEREKDAHLGGGSAAERLPGSYREEVDHPARAYEGATVFLAELDGRSVGVAVVRELVDAIELKRLWVDPRARGHRLGSALLDAVLSHRTRPVRLTVWDWRDDAITLYRSRGFVDVPSWEERARLRCLEYRPATRG